MADSIGKAVLQIVADSKKFYEDVDKAEGRAQRLGRNLSRLGSDFNTLGNNISGVGRNLSASLTVPIAGAVAAVASLTQHLIGSGNELAKSATEAGLSGQAYQELGYAIGQITQLAERDVARAFTYMTGAIGQATQGSVRQAEALRALGYTEAEIAAGTIDTEDAFNRLRDAVQKTETPAQAMTLTGALMGEEVGRRLAGALRESGGQVDVLRGQFRDLGLGMSDDALAAAENLTDQLDTTKRGIEAAGREIAAAFLPVLRDQLLPIVQESIVPALREFAGTVQRAVEWFGELSPTAQKALLILVGAAAALGPTLMVVGQMAAGIGSMLSLLGGLPAVGTAAIAIIKGLGAALVTNLGPALMVFAVGAAAYQLTTWLMENTEWGQKLTTTIGNLINAIRGIDTAELEQGVDVTKRWTDEEKKAYDAFVAKRGAIKGAADEAVAGEGRVKPHLDGRKLTEQELARLAAERAQRASELSEAEVALFGSSATTARQAERDFAALQQAITNSGQSIETMSSTQLYAYEQRLTELTGASSALPEVNQRITESLEAVGIRLAEMGLSYGTLATVQTPGVVLALQQVHGGLGSINSDLDTLNTIQTPAVTVALQTVAEGAATTAGAVETHSLEIQESTGNMALSITSAFSGLGQGLQQLGGQWSSWGSLVSSTAGTVAQGIGRIQAAQRQYGQDSERTSQETQAAYIDMGIGVGDAMASMGARYKAVAIAGAVISALLAAVRALASTGPPMNYVLAALSLAAGMATVARIRSSPACERGTPGLDYADFGRQTPAYLHHEEAVIPRGHGGPNILAGEIAAAMPGGGESGLLAEVRALRNDFARLPYTMNRAFRDGALLGTA